MFNKYNRQQVLHNSSVSINMMDVCRTCLRSVPDYCEAAMVTAEGKRFNSFLLPLAQSYIVTKNGAVSTRVSYLDCLRECTQLEISALALYPNGDFKYPMNICVRCSKALEVAYYFTKLAQESERKLRQYETDSTGLQLNFSRSFGLEQLDNWDEQNSQLSTLNTRLPGTKDRGIAAIVDERSNEKLENEAMQVKDELVLCSKEESKATIKTGGASAFGTDVDCDARKNKSKIWKEISLSNEPPSTKCKCKAYEIDAIGIPNAPHRINTPVAHDFIKHIKEIFRNGCRDTNLVRNEARILDDARELQKAIANNEVQLEDNELVCVQCNARFSDISILVRHINHHKGITPFRCKGCNYFTCYSESLRKHYKREHHIEATNDMLDMPIDPFIAPIEKSYHEVVYACKHCKFSTHEDSDMKAHTMGEHFITKDLDEHIHKAYNCPDCHRQFKDQKAMRAHFTLIHGTSMAIRKVTDEVHVCESCDKQFQFKNSLAAHQRACRLRDVINCHICTKKFTTLRKFEHHLRHDHAVETIHECEVCSKIFKNSEALSLHRKRHTERHYHCIICSRNYVNSSELKVHMQRVHNTEQKMTCRICDMTFTHVGLLRKHENKEHNPILYSCVYCDYQSTVRQSMRLHEFVHTGKPYKCGICGREFAMRIYLRHHAKNVHSIDLSDEELGAMFRQRFGYFSRYDSFSKHNNSLEITEVSEEDIEKELKELGLNMNDLIKDLFNAESNDELNQ